MPGTEPRVGGIVLNWNGSGDTLECLISLERMTYRNACILVVDNGSTDHSVEAIQDRFPDQELLTLPRNLLYAGGNNAGMAFLRDRGCKYLVFLNNDTLVQANFLEPMVQWMESHPGTGIIAPRIFYYQDKRVWFDGGIVNLWTGEIAHAGLRKIPTELPPEPHVSKYITGCCLMIRYDLALECQGFDEGFRMYAEDVALSLRGRERGYDLMVIPERLIYHKVYVSLGGAFSLGQLRRNARSMITLYGKLMHCYTQPVLIISHMCVCVPALRTLAGARASRRYR